MKLLLRRDELSFNLSELKTTKPKKILQVGGYLSLVLFDDPWVDWVDSISMD